jgi:hypothetical protein
LRASIDRKLGPLADRAPERLADERRQAYRLIDRMFLRGAALRATPNPAQPNRRRIMAPWEQGVGAFYGGCATRGTWRPSGVSHCGLGCSHCHPGPGVLRRSGALRQRLLLGDPSGLWILSFLARARSPGLGFFRWVPAQDDRHDRPARCPIRASNLPSIATSLGASRRGVSSCQCIHPVRTRRDCGLAQSGFRAHAPRDRKRRGSGCPAAGQAIGSAFSSFEVYRGSAIARVSPSHHAVPSGRNGRRTEPEGCAQDPMITSARTSPYARWVTKATGTATDPNSLGASVQS